MDPQARRILWAADAMLLIAITFISYETWTAWNAMESGEPSFRFNPSLLFALLMALPQVRHPARWASKRFRKDAKKAENFAFFGSSAAVLAVIFGAYLWFGSQITQHGYIKCPESENGGRRSSISTYAKEPAICRAKPSPKQGEGNMMPRIQERIAAMMKEEWNKTGNEDPAAVLFWTPMITPPFPIGWPVPKNSKITSYLYAAGGAPGLSDGVKISNIWGKVEYTLEDDKNIHFVRVTEKVKSRGIQGVRPLSEQEQAILKADWVDNLHGSLKTLSEPIEILRHLDEATKTKYCLWFRSNGTVTDELKDQLISAFYKQLQCF